MSNSLIQAAQRMYSAKYAEAQKDVTPTAKGISYLGANITKALDEKLEDQEKRAAKSTESFKDILLKSEKARPELTSQITELQDEYFENIKISERIFGNKKEKQDAVNRNSQIESDLKAWEEDLRSQDLNASLAGTVSDFEGDAGKAAKLSYVDKDMLANNITYKRGGKAGVYAKTLDKDGNIVEKRLSEWSPPTSKFQAGIDAMVETQQASVKSGSTGLDWNSYVLPELNNNLNKLMDDKSFGSLLFDDIGNFNWATQQMAQEFPDADLSDPAIYKAKRQELRQMVKENPGKYKQEFKDDVLRAYKMDYDKAFAKRKEETLNDKEERDTTFLAGQYIPNVDLLSNFTAIMDLKSKPGRTYATTIAGIPSLGRVWYDNEMKMYVYEDIDSSGLSTSEAGYKKSMTADIQQLLSSKTGGISNKFFVQSKSNDPFNPNN
jgi:hypothetical protein